MTRRQGSGRGLILFSARPNKNPLTPRAGQPAGPGTEVLFHFHGPAGGDPGFIYFRGPCQVLFFSFNFRRFYFSRDSGFIFRRFYFPGFIFRIYGRRGA